MRVLVTGGAGFIGSHVVDALVDRGHDVGVLDSLATGSQANVNNAAAFFLGDITNEREVAHAFQAFQPEVVCHQAAQVSVAASTDDPIADARTNVLGSLQVFEACRRFGVGHLVFASTGGALYGNPSRLPANEATPIEPLSPYGAAKTAVEAYLFTYARTWGLHATALRYSNVFGPRQSSHGEAGVVAIFTARMLAGTVPVIFGDGQQSRDFVYVTDVANANVVSIERGLVGAYNVGTGRAVSVNEVTRLLASYCAYHGEVRHDPPRPGEVQRITLDASRIQECAGWQPTVSLEEGLQCTVDAFRRQLAGGG